MKQCDANFGDTRSEKSVISAYDGASDKSGMPVLFDADSSLLMFDTDGFPDLLTGPSEK